MLTGKAMLVTIDSAIVNISWYVDVVIYKYLLNYSGEVGVSKYSSLAQNADPIG